MQYSCEHIFLRSQQHKVSNINVTNKNSTTRTYIIITNINNDVYVSFIKVNLKWRQPHLDINRLRSMPLPKTKHYSGLFYYKHQICDLHSIPSSICSTDICNTA